jgi:ribonucleotide monophosphatase NagD (HAD superfamily)
MDLSVHAIVMGWDFDMTFVKQCYICFHIQKGIKLFGTNPDKWISVGKYRVPGNGSIIATIEASSQVKA